MGDKLSRFPGYRRIEGYRFLRSDGKPNYTNRVYRVEKDMELLATRPPVVAQPTTPIIEAIERMYEKDVRSLVVVTGSEFYDGMLLAEHIISYLGGGELHDIVVNRYDDDIYKSMNEQLKAIMEREYPHALTTDSLPNVITLMFDKDLSLLPVLTRDKRVYGVISEHDIVELLSEKHTGVKAEEIMSSSIVSVESMDPLLSALRVMSRTGLRRVFVRNEAGQIIGVINARMIIEYYGSHKAYNYVKKGFLTETVSIPVRDLMRYHVVRVDPKDDLGEVASKMLSENVGAVIVSSGESDIGMITEHDVFYALAVPI